MTSSSSDPKQASAQGLRRRGLLLTLGAGLVAAAAGVLIGRWRRGDADAAEPTPAAQALLRQRFDAPGGGQLDMASLQGQWLVVNFWATWCAPCVQEMPELDRFHREHSKRGVSVVGLAVDGPTPVREFLRKLPVSFPIGLAGMEGTQLSRDLGNEQGGLPFTVVIDPRGVIRHRKLGETSPAELGGWVADLA